MNLNTKVSGDIMIVSFQDEALDAGNSQSFKQSMAPILEGHLKVILDMGQLQFIDSSGLGAILSCLRQLNGVGGDLKLSAITKPVRTLFELVRMHKVFDIFNSLAEAEASFKS